MTIHLVPTIFGNATSCGLNEAKVEQEEIKNTSKVTFYPSKTTCEKCLHVYAEAKFKYYNLSKVAVG
jgi:hypothetical protein